MRGYDTAVYTPPVVHSAKDIDLGAARSQSALSRTIACSYPSDNEERDTIRPKESVKLIIVDESDRLKTQGLEQLRSIYDEGKAAIILIGMPGLERRLARYPQLYSRVGFVHEFKPLSKEEVVFIIEQKWKELGSTFSIDDFTDHEALAALVWITQGNFRLLHRLLAQVKRILEINDLSVVTKEVVEAARENLVIGVV